MRYSIDDIPRRPEWNEPGYKDVIRSQFQFRESLPLPVVTYTHDYGTWLTFQASEDAQPHICGCHRNACATFLRLNAKSGTYHRLKDSSLVDHFLSRSNCSFNKLAASSIEELMALPIFKDGLCHICNRRVPSIRWSNLDEHSFALQHFGWYFRVAQYAAGVEPHGGFEFDFLDPELKALAVLDPRSTRRKIGEFTSKYGLGWGALDRPAGIFGNLYPGAEEMRQLQQELNLQEKKMSRLVEKRFRQSLGFPEHGKTGGSEIILYWIVKALFQPRDVLRRARLPFLGGMELDIFIPSLNFAIEYQGEQHFRAFKHFGGAKQFKAVRQRDAKKITLCKESGVDLRFVTFADKLTEDEIAKKLAD